MRMPTWPSVDGAGAAMETSGHHLPFSPQFGKAAWPRKVSSSRRDFPAPLGATMVASRRITAFVVSRLIMRARSSSRSDVM